MDSGHRPLRVLRALAVGLCGACLALAATPARAADPRPSWDLLTEDEPAEMRGYHPARTFEFTVPPGWTDFRDVQLTVSYLASPDIDPVAAISVDLNGTPVAVLDVMPGPGSAVVDLPPDRIATGDNEVKLDALLPLDTDSECVDPTHPARWLVLGEVSVAMAANPAQLDIRDYPHVLGPLGTPRDPAMTFVMPAHPGRDELSALSSVAFAAAQAGIEGVWRVRVDGEPADATGSGSTVWIGAPPGEALAGAAGRAWIERTPSEGVTLSLAAGPDGSVAAVADALGDARTLFPMEGGALTVITGPPRIPAEPPTEFSLAKLGYGPRTVHGSGTRSLIYTFDVPVEWSPEGTYLTADVVADLGRFAVALNGADVTRQTIAGTGMIPGDIDLIEIDSTHMRPGRNYLRFTFDLDDDARCTPEPGGPGGSVGAATRLRITHGGDGGRLDLADFHEMFAAETDMTDLLIVLPDEPTAKDLGDLVGVVRALRGSSSRFAPRAATSRELTEADLTSHLIILGERSRQWMIGLLDGVLPLELATDGTLPDAARMDLAGVPAAPGVIELAESPWLATRRVIAVTGAAPAGYDAALAALTQETDETIVRGRVALVGRAGEGAPLDVLSLHADDPAINPGSAGFVAELPVPLRVGLAVLLVTGVGVASTFLRRHPIRWRRRAKAAADHSG